VPVLLKEVLVISDQGRGVNYGLERVRFTSPVTVGSELRLGATFLGATRRADAGVQYRLALRIEVNGSERPAMVAESIYIVYPRAEV